MPHVASTSICASAVNSCSRRFCCLSVSRSALVCRSFSFYTAGRRPWIMRRKDLPNLSTDSWADPLRYGVACLGLHVISGDQTVIPCLRRLQRMAKERGRTTEATIAAECIGLWRKPDAQKHRRMVATLNSWVNLNSQPEMPQANSVIVSLRT